MAIYVHTDHPVVVGASTNITGIEPGSVSYNPGVSAQQLAADGMVHPRSAMITGINPTGSFNTFSLVDVLTNIGLFGTAQAAKITAAKLDPAGGKASGSEHVTVTFATAITKINSITASFNGFASAACSITGYGATPAVSASAQALPTFTAALLDGFSLHSIVVNGTAYEGLRSMTLSMNPSEVSVAGDSTVVPKHAAIVGYMPTFSVSTVNPVLAATVSDDGTAIASTDVVFYLAKRAANGGFAASNHISFTVHAGIVTPSSMTGNPKGFDFVVTPVYDVTAATTITVSTAASLPS